MFGDGGSLIFDGCYSGGNKGKVPQAINNPDYCHVKMTGPIPPGLYTIGEPYQDALTGSHTMSLAPDSGNEMFGRSEFKCHGDNSEANRSASEGCIIKSPASVRCQIYGFGENRLCVVGEPEEVAAVYAAPAPIDAPANAAEAQEGSFKKQVEFAEISPPRS